MKGYPLEGTNSLVPRNILQHKMRLNVFNQVNLQRACGYQAVVVSGCSGAVRLSLRSLLQWRAVTACTCFV